MRSLALILVVLFLGLACKSRNAVPAHIIPQKKMQAILWDLMRADLYLTDFVMNQDSSFDKKTGNTSLYRQVLDIHEVSQEEFRKSFSFYRSHPALLKVIMDSISKPVPVAVPVEPTPSAIKQDSLVK